MNVRWELGAALAVVGLLVALGTWTASDKQPSESPEEPASVPTRAAEPGIDRASAAGEPQRRAALPTASWPADVGAAIADAQATAYDEVERDELTRSLETRSVEMPERRARTDAVADLASRLGFSPGSRDGEELERWLDESSRSDREVLADAGRTSDSKHALVASFNAAAEERSRALIDRFGASVADEIAHRFPIHRLDPRSGALVRVDPNGRVLRLSGQD